VIAVAGNTVASLVAAGGAHRRFAASTAASFALADGGDALFMTDANFAVSVLGNALAAGEEVLAAAADAIAGLVVTGRTPCRPPTRVAASITLAGVRDTQRVVAVTITCFSVRRLNDTAATSEGAANGAGFAIATCVACCAPR